MFFTDVDVEMKSLPLIKTPFIHVFAQLDEDEDETEEDGGAEDGEVGDSPTCVSAPSLTLHDADREPDAEVITSKSSSHVSQPSPASESSA